MRMKQVGAYHQTSIESFVTIQCIPIWDRRVDKRSLAAIQRTRNLLKEHKSMIGLSYLIMTLTTLAKAGVNLSVCVLACVHVVWSNQSSLIEPVWVCMSASVSAHRWRMVSRVWILEILCNITNKLFCAVSNIGHTQEGNIQTRLRHGAIVHWR